MNQSATQSWLRAEFVAACLGGAALLSASGCAGSQWARSEPHSDHVYSTTTPQMLERESSEQPVPAEAHYPDDAAATYPPIAATNDDGVVRLGRSTAAAIDHASASQAVAARVTRASGTSDGSSEFQLTAFQPPAENCPDGSGFTAAEPRLEVDPNCPPSNQMELVGGAPLAELFPDEYLINGCDRDSKAAHHTTLRSGLDSQDTIGEFTDHTGELRSSASNCVLVYAPRFGSVRTVTSLVADTKVDQAAGANDSQSVGNLNTGHVAQENVHDTILSGFEGRNELVGVTNSQPALEARRTDKPNLSRKVQHGHEGRSLSSTQAFDRRDGIAQQQQVLNAIAWTRDLFPVITASTTNASQLKAEFKVQQVIGLEDERETKGALHLVKRADCEAAQPGDVITFTIDFMNTGDFDVYDVTIVDNLTPRLEYVSSSATIDGNHPGEVSVAPNGEGSEILTFTLDKPLKGHDRGTLTFQARVR